MSSEETYFNPFPGLRSFEEEEEYLFFGREKQIDELLNKLSKTRFLAVVGASGSGKSSLVKSGLLPSLHSGYLAAAGSGWRICTFRPGGDPIGNLAEALNSTEILGVDELNSPAVIEAILRRNDQGIGETIKQLSADHKQNLLIVVDQFEELFRFSKYEKAEQKGTRDSVTFINLLLAASKRADIPIYVVFTMRSDFLGDCTEFRGLPEAINEGQYLIPRMTREERKTAITGPIAVGGAEISQALLTRLLNDVGDNPDQLPILQHALMRTWDYWHKNSRPEDPIDLVHYEAIGTMSKALSLHAEEAYADIGDEKGKEVCKKLFRSLTEKRDDGRGIRRPTIVKEICELADIHFAELKRVIDIFRMPGRSFLMPPAGVELKEDMVIDISHESLMRVWERLIRWVQEEIESAELYTRLAQSAALYQEGKTGIWRDPELQMAINWRTNQRPNEAWAKRYDPSFDRAMNFLEYSESEKRRELEGAERKRKAAIVRLRIFISIITGAFCMAVYFGFSSYRNEKKARASEQEAIRKKQEADSLNIVANIEKDNAAKDRDIASREKEKAEESYIFANEQKKLAELARIRAENLLKVAEEASQRAKDSAEVAVQQRKEAVQSATIAKIQKEKAENAKREVDKLRLLAEARNIALKSTQIANDPGKDTLSVQLAFLSYAINRRLNGPFQNRVIYEALKTQLNRYYNKVVRSRKDLRFEPGGYDMRALTFVNSLQFISAGDEGSVKKWDMKTGPIEIAKNISGQKFQGNYSCLAASPDGKFIVGGTTDGKLVPIDGVNLLPGLPVATTNGKCVFAYVIPGNQDQYSVISVFEKATCLLKISRSGLQVISQQIVATPSANNFRSAAAFTSGEVTRLFVSEGKSVSIYEIRQDAVSSDLKFNFPETVSAIGVNTSGKYLVVGGTSGKVMIYHFTGAGYNFHGQIRGHISAITSLAFSSNDSLVASGSLDHSIHLSRLFKTPEEEDLVFREKDAWIRGLAFSPDNKYVVSTGQAGLIQIWPAAPETALEQLRTISAYNGFLSGASNEAQLKEELGTDLFKTISELEAPNGNFKDVWEGFQKKYLN